VRQHGDWGRRGETLVAFHPQRLIVPPPNPTNENNPKNNILKMILFGRREGRIKKMGMAENRKSHTTMIIHIRIAEHQERIPP
jgi:hypothetical protein